MARKVNMQFFADELVKRGKTRFFSFGFSYLSRLKHDPRMALWERSNKVETINGMECYLWRTPLHAVRLPPRFKVLEALLFRTYRAMVPRVFSEWVKESRTIIFESGFPIIFIRICKALNPEARLLYVASDSLKTIECADFIVDEFAELAPSLDGIALPSHLLSSEIPATARMAYVPHGLDKSIADHTDPSPYAAGKHAVSVGSMLFDSSFFQIAASAFPDITFHIIGGASRAAKLTMPNVKLYGEMPFQETIPYISHANFGIAPYDAKVAPFLVDTSMKLMQYGFLGVPAVCPKIVAGSYPERFGYTIGDHDSIVSAIRAALAHGPFPGGQALSWEEATDRLLQPEKFEDTKLRVEA